MLSTSQKIILLGILCSTIPFFSYAQETTNNDCFTCGSTSKEVQQFIDFSNQILDSLGVNSVLVAKGNQYQVFGPRQGGVYNGILGSSNPSSIIGNIVAGTLKNFDKRQSYLRSTADLLSIYSIDIVIDGGMGFLVSAQPRPVLRDYQLLLDIDTKAGDKIYDIGIAGGYGRGLTSSQTTEIKNIFDNNTGPGKIFQEKINISNATSSIEVLHSLLRLNRRYKKLVTLGDVKFDESIRLGSNADIIINSDHFNALVTSYKCVRIGQASKSCASSFKIFKENIKNISTSFKEKGPKQSREKIQTASKRLATRALQIIGQTDNDFYKNNEQDYIQREQEILGSQPGGKTLEKRNGLGILTRAFASNIGRTINADRSRVINNRNNAKNIYSELTKKSPFVDKQTKFQNTLNTIIKYLPSPQEMNISYDLDDIINEHAQMKENNLKASTTDSQYVISQTLLHIRIIHTALEDYIKEDIARTCELQCSNLGGICR